MDFEIDLYINSVYMGFRRLRKIEDYLREYAKKADILAESADWDEIVLYAILLYEPDTGRLLSADFMTLKMTYKRYIRLFSAMTENCKMLFTKKPED